MNIEHFVHCNALQPGDVLKVKKNGDIIDHYLVYLGFSGREHIFIANMRKRGVVKLERDEIMDFSRKYEPREIRKFIGSEWARYEAVVRAVRAMKKSAYHLLTSNCEHLANYVQYGKFTSRQSGIFGATLMGIGTLVAAKGKNEGVQALGALGVLAGAVLTLREMVNSGD